MDAYGDWLQATAGRLSADGFGIQEDVGDAGFPIRMLAHRSRFELTKFGNSETIMVFTEVPTATPEVLRAYSADAFRYAKRIKKSSLPCGLFESVWCYPVALTNGLDPAAAATVKGSAPTKHWAAAEIPVVYDSGTGALTYFQKTPIWGAAYYAGFRKTIQRYLGA